MSAGSVEVLSKSPRVLLLHPGDYDLLVQGEAASDYARGWLFAPKDTGIHVSQHLSHAIAPADPSAEPTPQSYWTFHLDTDHTWVADSAQGFAPYPVASLDAPPQWGDDGLTTWDHLVEALSHPGAALGSLGNAIGDVIPTWLKVAVGLGLFVGVVSVFRR